MSDNNSQQPGIKLTVATAEVQKAKSEGFLFYILPPLVVAAVFIYCMHAQPHWLTPPPELPLVQEAPMSEEEAEFFAAADEEEAAQTQQQNEKGGEQ